MNDSNVTSAITRAAKKFSLIIEKRRHGGRFCTVHLCAPDSLPWVVQNALLIQARDQLTADGVANVVKTQFDNPPYRNPNTGKEEGGHPRHGDPLLEVDSVWWVE
jgi:hypothetical protein